MKLIKQLLGIEEKTTKNKSFADFSSAEKKALIKSAARKANKMQRELVETYNKKYHTGNIAHL